MQKLTFQRFQTFERVAACSTMDWQPLSPTWLNQE